MLRRTQKRFQKGYFSFQNINDELRSGIATIKFDNFGRESTQIKEIDKIAVLGQNMQIVSRCKKPIRFDRRQILSRNQKRGQHQENRL